MSDQPMPLTPPTAPIDDIFAFCNHIAWQAGGPVLIHDSSWGVVAYSTLNQPVDEGRRAIILRRTVPDSAAEEEIIAFASRNFESGIESFEIPAYAGLQGRRIVAPVRMLGVQVGSIWIAESAGPLHPDVLAMARQAAKETSLYFQLREDLRRVESDRFTRMLLEGTQDEALLAQYLGVPRTTAFRVISIWHGGIADLRDQVREVSRIVADQQPAAFLSIDCDECICFAFYSPDAPSDVNESVRAFGSTMVSADERLLVGAGRLTTRLAHAAQSKADAEKVIAYLRHTPGERVASVNSISAQITLMRLVEILDAQFEPLPDSLRPLSMLQQDDLDEALRTLDAYFSHPGNASEAARELHIHPNTFRYRIAKVADLLGVDLEDRDSRLIVELALLRRRYGS
jgi:sugar diacid utilization regulator